jgi:hypothetical protein
MSARSIGWPRGAMSSFRYARRTPPRLYLAGSKAVSVASLFEATPVEARVIIGELGAASALKMGYAAWTKGTAALLLAIRALAREERVEDALDRVGDVPARSRRRATFADAGLPDGFHCAAAEVYRRAPRIAAADGVDLDRVIEAVRRPGGAGRT